MKKETEYRNIWKRLARKALFKHLNKRGEKYFKIYEYCKYRVSKI